MNRDILRKNESKRAKQRYKEYKRSRKPSLWKIILLLIAIILVIVGGVTLYQYDGTSGNTAHFSDGDLVIQKVTETQGSSEEIVEEISEETTQELVEEVSESSEEMTDDEIAEIVDGYLATMNTEARVGQLFFITPEELTGIGIAVQAGTTTKTMIKAYGVGGLIFSEQNFEVIDQMQLMVSNVKVYSSYPIFVAMDESGAVRITNTNNTLEEVGFNMASIESELYLLTDEGNVAVSEELTVVNLKEGDVLELVTGEADIIYAESGFETAYETVVSAVRNGEIEESLLEEKVRKIMTYKVKYGI